MNEKQDPPHPQSEEAPIDVQRRAIRAAVRRRLRGEVTSPPSYKLSAARHRICRSSGNVANEIGYSPLISP